MVVALTEDHACAEWRVALRGTYWHGGNTVTGYPTLTQLCKDQDNLDIPNHLVGALLPNCTESLLASSALNVRVHGWIARPDDISQSIPYRALIIVMLLLAS